MSSPNEKEVNISLPLARKQYSVYRELKKLTVKEKELTVTAPQIFFKLPFWIERARNHEAKTKKYPTQSALNSLQYNWYL